MYDTTAAAQRVESIQLPHLGFDEEPLSPGYGDAGAWGWMDRITRAVQGGGFGPVHGRTLESWLAVLTRLGFEVECRRMDGRLPFANLPLLVARHHARSVDD